MCAFLAFHAKNQALRGCAIAPALRARFAPPSILCAPRAGGTAHGRAAFNEKRASRGPVCPRTDSLKRRHKK
jgi:hypothetical protein